MKVCAEPSTRSRSGRTAGQRVSCWLHGPEAEIPAGGTEPLEREEILAAEEA